MQPLFDHFCAFARAFLQTETGNWISLREQYADMFVAHGQATAPTTDTEAHYQAQSIFDKVSKSLCLTSMDKATADLVKSGEPVNLSFDLGDNMILHAHVNLLGNNAN
jgi:hypothetical protein